MYLPRADDVSSKRGLEATVQNRTYIYRIIACGIARGKGNILAVEQVCGLSGEIFDASVEVASEQFEIDSDIEGL